MAVLDFWLERLTMLLLFGAPIIVVLFLLRQDRRSREFRTNAIAGFARALHQNPVKLAFRCAFMIAFFMFFGGLFFAVLGLQPHIPFLGWRIWTFGAVSTTILVVIGWLTGWN